MVEKFTFSLLPSNNRVLVAKIKEDETCGGFELPQVEEAKACLAKVIAVFKPFKKDDKKVTPSVKVGQKVIIGKWAGTEVTGALTNHAELRKIIEQHGVDNIYSINESDIQAIVVDSKEKFEEEKD